MKRLHLPDNIKIHFAGIESEGHLNAIKSMGINYALYSAFPFVFKKLFGKNKEITENSLRKIDILSNSFNHVIQDSGLFSLLYGSKQDLADKETVFKWYDALIEWTLQHGKDFAVVEIDCQDILGTDIAWDLRTRMRRDLPNHRIINVFHLSDGIKGLDRLIEFSDYIAIGSSTPRNSSYTMYEAASYIKDKNPLIDIHLLGCTKLETLKKCRFCTSADSTTWFRSSRFGDICGYHVNDLDINKVKNLVGDKVWNEIREFNNELNTCSICASIEMYKRQYQKYAGNQDYNNLISK